MCKKYLYLLVACLSISCYNEKKATSQFSKAATAYPTIGANFCSITYPPKTNFIKGDTITKTDTVKLEGNVVTDTLVSLDTIRITITKTLPGQTITKTIHVTDTMRVENTAQLKVCELERGKAISLLVDKTAEANLYKGKAKKRGLIMLSLIALAIVYIGWKLYSAFKPKVKA